MSSEMKEYRIIDSANRDLLVDTVDYWLKNGWECQGGVSVTALTNSESVLYLYAQAMVYRGKQQS